MAVNKLLDREEYSVNSFAPVDPYDMTNRFNTRLSPDEEFAFQQWAINQNRLKDLYDYDLRGFYKSGESFKKGHGLDKYKKPNHPTFSVESQYHGKDYQGGVWTTQPDGKLMFTPSQYNLRNMSVKQLSDYFKKIEPNVILNLIK